MDASIRAYARHRGCSHVAVVKAMKAGRIKKYPKGKINFAEADAAWEANMNPAKKPQKKPEKPEEKPKKEKKEKKEKLKPVLKTVIQDVEDVLQKPKDSKEITYIEARTANEILKVQSAKIKLKQLKDELIDKTKAVSQVFKMARQERDAWLNWPARVSAVMAAELEIDPHTIHITLEKYIRQHLEELSDITVNL